MMNFLTDRRPPFLVTNIREGDWTVLVNGQPLKTMTFNINNKTVELNSEEPKL